MSDPVRTETISDDPRDYLTGASSETINAGEGGTTRDGSVAVFGPSKGTDSAAKSDDSATS